MPSRKSKSRSMKKPRIPRKVGTEISYNTMEEPTFFKIVREGNHKKAVKYLPKPSKIAFPVRSIVELDFNSGSRRYYDGRNTMIMPARTSLREAAYQFVKQFPYKDYDTFFEGWTLNDAKTKKAGMPYYESNWGS